MSNDFFTFIYIFFYILLLTIQSHTPIFISVGNGADNKSGEKEMSVFDKAIQIEQLRQEITALEKKMKSLKAEIFAEAPEWLANTDHDPVPVFQGDEGSVTVSWQKASVIKPDLVRELVPEMVESVSRDQFSKIITTKRA